MDIRPYEIMHIIAKTGQGCKNDFGSKRLNKIITAVRQNPNIPLRLVCNTISTYSYQNPGHDNDTPEGRLFNIRRDLKILQMLGLVPGDTRPALELFNRVFENIKTAKDILWFEKITSPTWKGEPENNYYEKGIEKGIESIIPSTRSPEELRCVKKRSVKELQNAETLKIRPHHLMCMSCYYRGPDDLSPIEADNIFEIIDIMQKNPNIPVMLVEGPCMICLPCRSYDPEINKCIGDVGIGLRDELKDLYVLQKLGLKYGDIRTAKELYQLLFERIKSTPEVCGFGQREFHSREWRPCGGADGKASYIKSRKSGMGII